MYASLVILHKRITEFGFWIRIKLCWIIELVLLDNAYKLDKSYKLEDFFWTGSGDGSGDENNYETSTIYKTKTILSTVYIDKPSTHNNQVSITSFYWINKYL